MALPPQSLACVRPVRIEGLGGQRFRVIVGEHALPGIFGSAHEALRAGEDEVRRLDAVALALLRHIRSRSRRKQG